LLESERLGFENQIDAIDKEKDPALKLEKNKLLLQRREQQTKLDSILEQEKKIEDEQKFITEKEQTTTIASQRKSLQQSRQDLEKKLEDVEKKRWEVEKQIQDTDSKVGQIDKSSESLVIEKNGLRDKVLGADKSLREIYSAIMAREEDKRRGQAEEQITKREALSKIKAGENERIQRQQWSGASTSAPKKPLEIPVPIPVKRKLAESFRAEEEARKKFIQDVEQGVK
jgi:chromosome segregation ATPase